MAILFLKNILCALTHYTRYHLQLSVNVEVAIKIGALCVLFVYQTWQM